LDCDYLSAGLSFVSPHSCLNVTAFLSPFYNHCATWRSKFSVFHLKTDRNRPCDDSIINSSRHQDPLPHNSQPPFQSPPSPLLRLNNTKSPKNTQILNHLPIQPQLPSPQANRPCAPFSTNSHDTKRACRYHPYIFFLDRIFTCGAHCPHGFPKRPWVVVGYDECLGIDSHVCVDMTLSFSPKNVQAWMAAVSNPCIVLAPSMSISASALVCV
jgi:hypothetical protein